MPPSPMDVDGLQREIFCIMSIYFTGFETRACQNVNTCLVYAVKESVTIYLFLLLI